MDTTDLARALRAATDGLGTRPGFTADVLRGGKRRRVRKRVLLAGATAVVIAAAGTAVVELNGHDDAAPQITTATNQMLTAPTRGDLATDHAYLDAAVAAFDKGMPNEPDKARVGRPRVYWAGTTDAGKVAVVVQVVEPDDGVEYHPDGRVVDMRAVQRSVVGLLVGTKPVLVNSFPQPYSTPPRGFAFIYGPHNRDIIAMGADNLSVSPGWTYITATGKPGRLWTPMVERKGVWLGQAADRTPPEEIRVVTGDPAKAGYDQTLTTLPSTRWSLGTDRQAKPVPENVLRTKPTDIYRVGGSTARPLGDNIHETLTAEGLLDPLAGVSPTGAQFVVDRPTGGSVVAVEVVTTFIMSHLFLAERDAAGTITRWTSCDPVHRDGGGLVGTCVLPGESGYFAVAPGMKLSYQTQTGDTLSGWIDAGTDAAVFPPNATAVQLLTPEGRSEVHSLLRQ
ncbi:hypothetical protein [Actinokineospora diospyrosa]|uniref:Type VII secretion protein EccB n=1 Tax=Actinokineospora diospyrosa TaxID=103728 RepID=A0ABT1I8G7_9PSEU|nr:hypothetical protein [Actinokineospora diospyrosa]MCP2268882.1 hypothetical protein [Actinokineospora diospyrosa]